MKRILLFGVAALAAIAIVLTAPTARAGTATATLAVSADVVSSCTIDDTTLDFGGTYDGSVAVNATATMSIHCTSGGAAWFSFGQGSNFSAGSRRMAGGVGEFLAYGLFADSNHTVPYDTIATDPGAAYHVPLNSVLAGIQLYTYTIYGQIPAAQYVSGGHYTDTVQSTVHF